MYLVYAIYNAKNNKTYIGQTENIEERLKQHNEKAFKNSYTSKFDGKWVLIYKERVENRSHALIREKQLKSFRGRESLKQYIPL